VTHPEVAEEEGKLRRIAFLAFLLLKKKSK